MHTNTHTHTSTEGAQARFFVVVFFQISIKVCVNLFHLSSFTINNIQQTHTHTHSALCVTSQGPMKSKVDTLKGALDLFYTSWTVLTDFYSAA